MVHDAATEVYDTAILVTADSDLIPAAEFTRLFDKDVELIVFPTVKPVVSQLLAEATLVRKARQAWFRPYCFQTYPLPTSSAVL